jgi:hypothetical protein
MNDRVSDRVSVLPCDDGYAGAAGDAGDTVKKLVRLGLE